MIADKFMTYKTSNTEDDFFKQEQILDFLRSRYISLMEKSNIISKKWQKEFKRQVSTTLKIQNMKNIYVYPSWEILQKNQDDRWLKVWYKIDKKTNEFIQNHSKEFDKRQFYRTNGEAK